MNVDAMKEQVAARFDYKNWKKFLKKIKSTSLQIGDFQMDPERFEHAFDLDNVEEGDEFQVQSMSSIIVVPYASSGHSDDTDVIATDNLTLLSDITMNCIGAKVYCKIDPLREAYFLHITSDELTMYKV